jgi:hypothetical protein
MTHHIRVQVGRILCVILFAMFTILTRNGDRSQDRTNALWLMVPRDPRAVFASP